MVLFTYLVIWTDYALSIHLKSRPPHRVLHSRQIHRTNWCVLLMCRRMDRPEYLELLELAQPEDLEAQSNLR